MSGTRTRPNKNHILALMRDGDLDDPWGLAMSWLWGCAEVLYDADPNMVPPRIQYRPGMGGPEVPNGSAEPHRITLADVSYETAVVWCWLHNVDSDNPPEVEDLAYWSDPTFSHRATELVEACILLDRYIDWLRAAGKDY